MSWTGPVRLTGEHVVLEPLREDHAPGVLAAADDDAVFEHLSIHRPTTEDEAAGLVRTYRDRPASFAWAQVEAATGRVVGLTTFYDVDEDLRTVAVGHTWLARRVWRTAVNTEAKRLLLTHAFDTLGCVRVVWQTDARNLRSQAAIERLGAVPEGVLRKHRRRKDGSWRDTVTYSLTDEEWVRSAWRDAAR